MYVYRSMSASPHRQGSSPMIETANAPPLELHDADEQLNAKLPRMYDPVEGARTAIFLLAV